ncbi:MAG: beta-lactamase family protein [Cyclobacteriaceae bacterium]|jgi:CubicO group peptidase (beta-lactamase class C family)|nr:beta-lactamase family protein [Cyclobacteriaceae bacterium]
MAVNRIDAYLKKYIDRGHAPSVQYAFFDDADIHHSFRYGLRNVGRKLETTSETSYHLFSITKTFTALAVLQLAEQGGLKLDAPVATYLNDFPYGPAVTVDQLLSHTAGIPNPMPLRWIHLEEEHTQFDRDSFFKNIFAANPKLAFSPGTRFKYSNLGYVLLGQLIERLSGVPYESYVRDKITAIAGIEPADLGFVIDKERAAVGYHKRWTLSSGLLGLLIDKGKFMGLPEENWRPFRNFYINGVAYGGLLGTARGLIAYGQCLLKPDCPWLSGAYRKELFTERRIGGKTTGMSYSWFTGTLENSRYFAHAGGGGGYYAELRLYPDRRLGSVILFNRSGMRDERFLDRVDRFLL